MAEATTPIDPSVTAVIPATEKPAKPEKPKSFTWGTGRRKSSVARVRIAPGSGKIIVNERELNDYFSREPDRKAIFAPLETSGIAGKVDVWVNTEGGGTTGQSGAIVMGLARAIVKYDQTTEIALRTSNYLTRDSRMKERKKYGQRGARRRFQFSKR